MLYCIIYCFEIVNSHVMSSMFHVCFYNWRSGGCWNFNGDNLICFYITILPGVVLSCSRRFSCNDSSIGGTRGASTIADLNISICGSLFITKFIATIFDWIGYKITLINRFQSCWIRVRDRVFQIIQDVWWWWWWWWWLQRNYSQACGILCQDPVIQTGDNRIQEVTIGKNRRRIPKCNTTKVWITFDFI